MQTVSTTQCSLDFHIVWVVAILNTQIRTQVLHQGAAETEGFRGLLECISEDHSSINKT
jgi:hypothetical protein